MQMALIRPCCAAYQAAQAGAVHVNAVLQHIEYFPIFACMPSKDMANLGRRDEWSSSEY